MTKRKIKTDIQKARANTARAFVLLLYVFYPSGDMDLLRPADSRSADKMPDYTGVTYRERKTINTKKPG